MTRQVVLTFFGRSRYSDVRPGEDESEGAARAEHQPHESPWTMTVPLVVLAALSAVGGFIQLPFGSGTKWLEHWLAPAMFHNEAHLELGAGTLWLLALVAMATAAAGIGVGIATYLKGRIDPVAFERPILAEAWRLDHIVSDLMGGPGRTSFEVTTRFDEQVVDGAVNGIGTAVRSAAGVLRRFQNGLVRTYSTGVAVGAVALLLWFLSRSAL